MRLRPQYLERKSTFDYSNIHFSYTGPVMYSANQDHSGDPEQDITTTQSSQESVRSSHQVKRSYCSGIIARTFRKWFSSYFGANIGE
jgi:hypothetical protein